MADYLIRRFGYIATKRRPKKQELKILEEMIAFIVSVSDYNFDFDKFVDYIERRNEKLADLINRI